MPTNKPFFPNLREVKKVITPKGEVLVRKTCKPVEALVMVEVEGTQKGARFVGIFARNGQAIRCPPLDSLAKYAEKPKKWRVQGDDFRTFLGDFVATMLQIHFPD